MAAPAIPYRQFVTIVFVIFLCDSTIGVVAADKQHDRRETRNSGTSKGGKIAEAAADKRPNFLVLLVDDLGYGDVGVFGNTSLPTPNIDRLAAGGAMLTQSLSAAAICTPSRAALLTGRLPVRYGLAPKNGEWDVTLFVAAKIGLAPNETTIPKLLGRHGYRRSLVGKWHLGDNCNKYGDHCHHPLTHGFETFYGLPMTNLKDFGNDGEYLFAMAYPNTFPICYALMIGGVLAALLLRRWSRLLAFLAILVALAGLFFAVFISNLKILSSILIGDLDVVEQPIRLRGLTQRLVVETEAKLRQYATENKNKGTPFFHMHGFSKVHTALDVLPEFKGRSKHGIYGDSVMELDWAVGRILDVLDELKLSRNTLVYFTSDNGGHVEERGIRGDVQGGYNGVLKGGKGMGSMEGGIRMPTIARYPPKIKPGTVIDLPVSTMDLMPTVVKMAGLDIRKELPDRVIDGKDMMPLLSKEVKRSPHQFLFHYCKSTIHAVRWMENPHHTWKVHLYWPPWIPGTQRCPFICHCQLSLQLPEPVVFNIQNDISEERPLPNTSSDYSRVVARVRRAMREHLKGVEDVESEMTWWGHMWRPTLQPCCNPPYCRCEDKKYPNGY